MASKLFTKQDTVDNSHSHEHHEKRPEPIFAHNSIVIVLMPSNIRVSNNMYNNDVVYRLNKENIYEEPKRA